MTAWIIASICFAFQALRGILDSWHLLHVTRWLKEPGSVLARKQGSKKTWYLLVPVLNEQQKIVQTISSLLQLKDVEAVVYVVIITTEKEENRDYGPRVTTKRVIQNALQEGIWGSEGHRVLLFHDLNRHGSMASQLNVAAQEIVRRDPTGGENYFILYNADSDPAPDTLRFAISIANREEEKHEVVFQLPCAFTKGAGMQAKPFVNALSLFQTWFCLGHEIPLLQRYENRIRKVGHGTLRELFYSPLGYVVGHGSATRFGTLLKYGGYPEHLLTEDLTFGYILSANRVFICVAPSLEVASVPLGFMSFIKQRSVWFWNYIEYFLCFNEDRLRNIPASRRFALLLIGTGRGLYWLFSSLFYTIPFILGILTLNGWITIFAVIGLVAFHIMPMLYLLKRLPACLTAHGLDSYAQNLKKVPILPMLPAAVLIIFTDSLGPWIALCKAMWYLPQGQRPKKYKTEQ